MVGRPSRARLSVAACALALAIALGGCETLNSAMAQPATTGSSSAATGAAPPTSFKTDTLSNSAQSAELRLQEAERALARAAQADGLGPALANAIDPVDGVVIRAGRVLQGRDQIIEGLRPQPGAGQIFWQPDRVHVAQSGDLGVTSGRYVQVLRGREARQGRYLLTWRRDYDGSWKVLSEVALDDPPIAAPPEPRTPAPAPRRRR